MEEVPRHVIFGSNELFHLPFKSGIRSFSENYFILSRLLN